MDDNTRLKVYLFGSTDLSVIPDVVKSHMEAILQQRPDTLFIVGDNVSIDSGYHKTLSAIGARQNSRIYALDRVRNNHYELDTILFETKFDEDEGKAYITYNNDVIETIEVEKASALSSMNEYYMFTTRRMLQDCDFAICYWDGENKTALRTINSLKARSKYVYVYTAQVR